MPDIWDCTGDGPWSQYFSRGLGTIQKGKDNNKKNLDALKAIGKHEFSVDNDEQTS